MRHSKFATPSPSYILATSVAVLLLGAISAKPATVLYWDTNGPTSGSGNANGTWDGTTADWSTDAAGALATQAWQAGDIADFAAGTDFTGTRTVTVSGTQSLAGIVADSELTSLTLTGGALSFGSLQGSIDTSALGQGSTTNAKQFIISSALSGTGGLTINANGNTSSLTGGSSSAYLQLGGDNTGLTGGISITGGLVDALTAKAFGNNLVTLSNGGGILDANHNVTLANNIALASTGGTIRSYGSATTTFTGQISDAVSGTPGSLTFTDSGTRVLYGNNTYSGGTTIGAGVVRVGNNNALGSGTVTFAGSSILATANGGPVVNLANAIVINSGVTASLDAGYADMTLSGTISGTGNLTKSATGTLTIAGSNTGYSGTTTISAAGTLAIGSDTALGVGTINLNNAGATFSSADVTTHTLANAITLSANTTFGTTSTGNLTFTGGIAGGSLAKTVTINNAVTTFSGILTTLGSGVVFTKAGLGTLTLSGSNQMSDQTAITAGTLNLDYSVNNNDKISSIDALVLGGGNLTITPSTSGNTLQSVTGTKLNSGSSTITVNADASVDNSTLALNTITRSTGGTMNVVYTTPGTGAAAALVNNTNTNGVIGGWATFNGADWAVNSTNASGGAVGALPAGSYVADAWASGNNTDVSIAGANPASGSTTNSLRFNATGAKTLTLAGTNIITSGGILETAAVGANVTTITGGTLEGGSGADLIVNQYNMGGALTISSTIVDNGSATALTKSGSGTLILGGANTYTGATYLNGGALKVSADNYLGVAPSSVAAGQLTFNGGTLQFGAAFSLSANRGITLNAAGGTIDTSTYATTYSGIISGAGQLTRKGAGDLTLSGANTFSGGVNMTSGTLRVQTNTALGAGPVVVTGNSALATTSSGTAVSLANLVSVNSGVTLSVDSGYASVTLNGVISGAGNVATTSSGTTVLTATNTYSGTTSIGASSMATIQLGNTTSTQSGSLGTGNVTLGTNGTLSYNRINSLVMANSIADGGTIAINNTGSLYLTGALSGAGTLSVNTASSLTLSGSDSGFTGKASVNYGTLTLDYSSVNTSKLGDSSVLTLGNASIILNGGSHTELVGSTTLTASTVSSVTQTAGFSVLSMGAITRNSGAVINFSGSGIAQTSKSNTNGILGGWATVGGANWAANDGSGNIVAYSGYIPVALGGAIADGASTNVSLTGGTSGNISLGASMVTVNTLLQNETNATTLDTSAGTLLLGAAGGILLPSGTGALTIGTSANSGALTAGGASNTAGEVIFNGTGNAFTVNTTIVNNGSGAVSVTKTGSNDLVLSGGNSYSGGTTLSGGAIRILNTNSALGTGAVTVTGSSTLAAASGSSAVSLGNNISLVGNTVSPYTLSVDSTNASLTLGGGIAGTGNLAVTGTGITILTGANTYSGTTTIGSGAPSIYTALQIGNGGATGAVGAGNIVFGGTGTNLVYASTGTTTMGASTQLLSGAGNFIVMNGTLKFGNSTAANTYTGDTMVYGGTLQLVGSLFNAGSGSALGTGRLYIEPGGTVTNSSAHPFGNNNTAQTMSVLGGTFAPTTSLYIAGFDLAGATVSGAGDIRNGGSRTNNILPSAVSSSFSNVYNPNAAGSNTATFYVNDGPATVDLLFSGSISSATGVVKAGAGVIRLTSSTANGYTGATTLNGGTLNLDFSGSTLTSNMLNSASSPTFAGGNLTITGQVSAANTQTLGNVTVNAGGSSITLAPGSAGTVGLTLGNTWTRAIGGTLTLNIPTGATLTSAPAVTTGILPYATVNGTDFAAVSNGNVVPLSTYSTDSYTTTDNTDFITAASVPSSALTINSLRFNVAQTNALTLPTGTNTISSGGLLVTSNVGANNTTIGGGTLVGSSNGDLIVQQFNTNGTLTINSVIANNGTATGLTKAGPGTLILGGTNTYTGTTFVTGGILQFSTAANLGNSAAPITFGGGTLQWASGTTTDITNARTVTIGSGGGTLDTNGNNVALGTAFGTGSSGTLTKAGNGKLTLSVANPNFTGSVVVNRGTLVATNATALGSNVDQSIIINSGATLDLATNTTSASDTTAVLRNFYVNGGTMENVSGACMRLGNVWLNGGTLNTQNGLSSSYTTFYLGTLQNNTAGANGTIFVEGSTPSFITTTGTTNNSIQLGPNVAFQVADVTGNANADLTVSAPLSNQSLDQSFAAGGFTKFGAGTMTLTATNTYTGGTVINAGTLVVTGSIAGSITTVNSGGTLSGTGTIGGAVTAASGGTIAPGVNGLGVLHVNNAVNLGAGSTFSSVLSGLGAGQTGELSATSINLAGGPTLQLALQGYVPAPGDLLVLALNAGSETGAFGNTTPDSNPNFFGGATFNSITVGGYEFAVSYNATASSFTGGTGIALMAVPEPTSLAALLGGMGMLAGLQRFRRRS